ncbi:hypothetical protein [Myxococcus sp. Y35]|uniref:hypothetical protein n=1 Tax=Pseudomyxococcus flavus TaxID=3115648 RepID=UPI003CF58DD1
MPKALVRPVAILDAIGWQICGWDTRANDALLHRKTAVREPRQQGPTEVLGPLSTGTSTGNRDEDEHQEQATALHHLLQAISTAHASMRS